MIFQPPTKHYKSILIIRANAVSDFRMELAATALGEAGYDIELVTDVPFYKSSHHDLIICCRPGAGMLEFIKISLAAGRQVVLDFDDDFFSIPKHNPAFPVLGAGHPTYLTELRHVINAGVVMTYATAALAQRYKVEGVVIPNTWDDSNPAWTAPKTKRGKVKGQAVVNIGWSGTSTHREDWEMVDAPVKAILNDYPQARIVVSGDNNIYDHFVDYAESRKLFLPGVPYNVYPNVYRWVDVLLVPLRDTFFNRAKSDIKMVEAGASKTVYVASALPMYEEWKYGGFLVKSDLAHPEKAEKAWYEAIETLILNPETVAVMAEAGHEQAQARAASLVGQKWVELVKTLFDGERAK